MIKQQQQFNNNVFQYILTISSSHVFIIFYFEWEQVHIFPHVPMFQCSKEVLWSWWAWKRNDVPSWRRRSWVPVSSAGSKRKIPRVWSVDPMVLEWCKKELGKTQLGKMFLGWPCVNWSMIFLWRSFWCLICGSWCFRCVTSWTTWHHGSLTGARSSRCFGAGCWSGVESWTAESMEQWKTWSLKPKGLTITIKSDWWFGTFDYFSIYWESSSQLTNSIIFQRGGSTTNQKCVVVSKFSHSSHFEFISVDIS